MRGSILLFIVLTLSLSNTTDAQNFSFEPVPAWVKPIDIPKESSFSKYEIAYGYYLTLADYQVNLEKDAFFTHEVRNVVSYSGITNASQLAITYDTSYQQLRIHHLYIWRKGEKIDRTSDLSFEIMNNEYNLNQGIYTGKITSYDNLNDIRKDDLIDFAYTLTGDNPIFENGKYLLFPLEAMNPIDLYGVRVIYPEKMDYQYDFVDCDSLSISVKDTAGYTQIEIYNLNVPAIKYEDYMPTWSMPYKYFILSSFKSWKDVNLWAQNVFALDKVQNLDAVFNEIFTGDETIEEKINKIINYVQDDIRYMGIESGIGSIKPFSPEQVVKQRFGDCKDKSLLLVSLLNKIGVEKAYPALVNTIIKHEVARLFPSNEAFNHCIVTFEFNNDKYWCDPSISMQGGDFKNLYNVDYEKVLIIGMPEDTLSNMSLRETKAGTNIIEELTINSFTEPAKLTITSDRYGFEADSRRVLMEYNSIDDVSKAVTDDLKLIFPTVNKTSDVKIKDDIEKNIFSVFYNYEVDGFWQDGDKGTNDAAKGYWLFKYEPRTMYPYLSVSACEERKYDFELNYPLTMSYRMIFHFPKDILIYDDYDTFDNEAFFYEEKVEQTGKKTLQVDYTFRIKAKTIKASDYKRICDQKNSIAKDFPIIIYFPK